MTREEDDLVPATTPTSTTTTTTTNTGTSPTTASSTTTRDDGNNGEKGKGKAPQSVNKPSDNSEDGDDPSADVNDHQHCNLCSNCPCLLDQGLYEELVMAYDLGLDPDFPFLTSKEQRFRLYRHATSWIHGYLGKGNRIELPQCVRTEIRDLAPESTGNYVGFKKRKYNDEESNPQDH